MNIASCGLGTNSVAGIILAIEQGCIFDEILFANTGRGKKYGERAATYDFFKIFNNWLKKRGHKPIKMLFSKNAKGKSISLYEEVYKLNTLPAIVFGFKTCSQRFKVQPQNKYINSLVAAQKIWASGEKITKWIFYDSDEPQRAKEYEDDKFLVRYFLIENDIDRYECEKIIINAGLPLPQKSSCYYCPSMKPYEIIDLYLIDRAKFYEAIELERNALIGNRMTAVKGLGRNFSWWDLIVAYRYMIWVKKSDRLSIVIDKSVSKLMKKINSSELKKNNRKNKKTFPMESAQTIVCSMFDSGIDLPCGCYDG